MTIDELLDALAKVLIRSFIGGFIILLFCVFIMLAGDDFVYKIHSQWFDISKQQFDLLWYAGITLFKTFIFVFFLIPYIAIRLIPVKESD